MFIKVLGRQGLIITEGMEQTIREKLLFLEKFLKVDSTVNVTVSINKDIVKIEILFAYNNQLIKKDIEDNDFYVGIEKITTTLKNVMSKNHDIIIDRNKKKTGLKNGVILKEDTDKDNQNINKIVKRKNFSMKPMMEEEAILQMKLLGHSSFMFLNAECNFTMCLLYERKDGNYGIIESNFYEEDEE